MDSIRPASMDMVKAQHSQSVCPTCKHFSDCESRDKANNLSTYYGMLIPIIQCNQYEEVD